MPPPHAFLLLLSLVAESSLAAAPSAGSAPDDASTSVMNFGGRNLLSSASTQTLDGTCKYTKATRRRVWFLDLR